ncbi:MAG: MBL fold metallo-hydrolase [Aphanizomenon sp.]|jgi:Cft2 family RNA processing exonuclease
MRDNLSVDFDVDIEEIANELECFPYSVQHEDEGVCLLVRMGPHSILLDFGLTNISPIARNLTKSANHGTSSIPADLVLVSHAHPDHARGLLTLHQAFPSLPIYASEVTTKLLPLNWLEAELPVTSSFCQALPLRAPIEIKENLIVELFPAGHLPGAVAILLTYHTPNRDYKLFYTGDFFLSNSRLVEGLRLDDLRGLNLDVLLIEGSYGTSRHPHRRHQENQLAERIHRAISSLGTDESYSVILPTPVLGLGQELLMLLRSHHHFTGRDLDIWVDGTVAAGCDAYLELLPHLPTAVQNFARHQPLFWDERVKPRVRRLKPENLANLGTSPCIVITDSSADLRKYCRANTGNWLILLPEKIDIPVNQEYLAPTKFASYLLAQHSDGPGTTQLIHNLRPQHVIFVHGSPSYLADLTCLEELQNRYHVHSPAAGTLVELPIGEIFLQPAAPETNYGGELTELGTVINITLPDTVTADPRWRQFADTGLIEARWQGEDLVLRGLSPRELLNPNNLRLNSGDAACCGSCRHQRGQRCWNPAAPLYNFKVTLDGYCPAFERLM